MKEKDTIKKILGISQEEIAMLLGVTRTHWSMYEIGERDLPLVAVQELTKMMQYMQGDHFKDKEILNFLKEEEQDLQKLLEKEIKKNEYKTHRLKEKIKQAERLCDEGMAALRLAGYLDTKPKNERTAQMCLAIRYKAIASLRRNYGLLQKHSLDIETLALRNEAITKIMKKNKKFIK